MKTICLQITLFLSMLHGSRQDVIQLPTKMKYWMTLANSNTNEMCQQFFRYEKRTWRSISCNNRGTNNCILATEKYDTLDIREITISIVVVTEKPRKDLVLGYVATDTSNTKYRQIHDITISADENEIETHFTHTINVTSFKDIVLEFSNFYGYCGTVKEFKLSYKSCDMNEDTLVNPLIHGAPNIADQQVQVNGSCKPYSSPDQQDLYYTCLSNGTVTLHGGCTCLAGYFRVHNNRCVKCPKYTYKLTASNEECKTCGTHSYSSYERDKCLCRYGFHREINQLNNFSAPCYSSRPLKVIISSITSDSAYVEWKVVNKSINWDKIHFTIDCDNCLDNEGGFPFQTYKHYIQLNDLEPSKKYVISVTSSSEQGIAQIASTSIWGKFITAHASYGKDIITITIISIIVPLVTITTTIFVYMYCRQKKKSENLRKKISSLKRQRRPPKPPCEAADDKEMFHDDATYDTVSDINPYAVFVPPYGFKMCEDMMPKDVADGKDNDGKDNDGNDNDGKDNDGKDIDEKAKTWCKRESDYETMGGIECCTDFLEESSSENPYIQPTWSPTSNNHSYIDIKDADEALESLSLLDKCHRNYQRNKTPPACAKYANVEKDIKRDSIVQMRPKPRLNPRARATSCLYKGFECTLDVNEMNHQTLTKLNSKYSRLDSEKQLDLLALIKRSHSADDINKVIL